MEREKRTTEEIENALKRIAFLKDIDGEDFYILEDASRELFALRSRISALEAALSLSPESVERYHQDLFRIARFDIGSVISGIRWRVWLKVKDGE